MNPSGHLSLLSGRGGSTGTEPCCPPAVGCVWTGLVPVPAAGVSSVGPVGRFSSAVVDGGRSAVGRVKPLSCVGVYRAESRPEFTAGRDGRRAAAVRAQRHVPRGKWRRSGGDEAPRGLSYARATPLSHRDTGQPSGPLCSASDLRPLWGWELVRD